MRFLLPIILVLAALGLFVLYTSPTYHGFKVEQAQVAAYDDALNKSKELKALRDKLTATRNAFRPEDEQKLARLLPDQVDNIRLVIDINNIAARHGLSLSSVALGDVSQTSSQQSGTAVGPSSDPVGSVSLGFGVVASYEDFLSFLQDVEHSLRILDIEKISFDSGKDSSSKYAFSISLRTYWLH